MEDNDPSEVPPTMGILRPLAMDTELYECPECGYDGLNCVTGMLLVHPALPPRAVAIHCNKCEHIWTEDLHEEADEGYTPPLR